MYKHKFSFLIVMTLALVMSWSLISCSKDDDPVSSDGMVNPPAATNMVNIPGLSFSPANITITAGTKVTWTNNDNTTHTVTSDDGGFTSSGNLSNGQTYEFTFTTAGSFPYHCSIHPSMTCTITVTP